MQYLGSYYGRESELPFTDGMKVRIRKGATLRSTHPQKNGSFTALRSQVVTVHHMLFGRCITMGHKYKSGNIDWMGFREKEITSYCNQLGIPLRDHHADTIAEALDALRGRCREHKDQDGSSDMRLDLENPKVRWAGSGGYWVECDVNEVDIVEAVEAA